MNAVERWWRESDHFDWLTLYLNTRGIRLIWRAMVAAVIASIAVVPTLVLLSPSLSHYPAAVVVAPIASGFGVVDAAAPEDRTILAALVVHAAAGRAVGAE